MSYKSIEDFPEIDSIQQGLIDASSIIGEANLPATIKEAWAAAQKLSQKINSTIKRLNKQSVKKYEEGKLDGYKEGWNADPMNMLNCRAECFDELVGALKLYMQVGDQCSRGYLARCQEAARAALAKAEAAQ